MSAGPPDVVPQRIYVLVHLVAVLNSYTGHQDSLYRDGARAERFMRLQLQLCDRGTVPVWSIAKIPAPKMQGCRSRGFWLEPEFSPGSGSYSYSTVL